MRIGEVTRKAGVTARTLRYYESVGLMPPGERKGGQRYYDEATIVRLRKIDQLKALGLGLDEIRGVIDLYFTDPSGVHAKRKVLAVLRAHLADVDARLAGTRALQRELQVHVARFERWLAEHDR
jgi:DNA-binding transcriptional MerR regulator